VVTSTNFVAGKLPAWNAVRADTQTEGRGRFQRTWISDEGGLWLSAVVPLGADAMVRRALPLAAGLAICDTLKELGVAGFRLRWPNDVLVADRKLAGLLIDQFAPGLAVVGIGINVNNRPEAAEPELKDLTVRLADLLTTPPELPALTALLLRRLRAVLTDLQAQGAASVFVRVNKLWMSPRSVELDLDGTTRLGIFNGIDTQGRLVLADSSGQLSFYEAHQVRHLTET
jgi:BirA family biotin operon repressor/biotin-[acetyl-CoA-carboxylase] ligase